MRRRVCAAESTLHCGSAKTPAHCSGWSNRSFVRHLSRVGFGNVELTQTMPGWMTMTSTGFYCHTACRCLRTNMYAAKSLVAAIITKHHLHKTTHKAIFLCQECLVSASCSSSDSLPSNCSWCCCCCLLCCRFSSQPSSMVVLHTTAAPRSSQSPGICSNKSYQS